ncbi:MAG TPA: YciI family protein [Euzebyales bacterium]
MAQYLLSVHTASDDAAHAAMTDEEMQRTFQQIAELEEDMKTQGAWMFSARLHEPDTATVVRNSGGQIVTTDGPYVESKEHLAGFYIIEAPDLDAALEWAGRTTSIVGAPIEVRPFAGFKSD